ncbi:hypothetical protein D3C81_961360 [compost metagenome]
MVQPRADFQIVHFVVKAERHVDLAVGIGLHPLLGQHHLALRGHRFDPETAIRARTRHQLQHVLAGAGTAALLRDHVRLAHAGAGALEGIQRCIHVDAVAQLAIAVQLDAVVAVHQQRAPVAVGRAILERGAAINVGQSVVRVGVVELARGVFQVHRFQVPVLVVLQQHRRLHVLQADHDLVIAVDLQLPGRFTQPQRACEGEVLRIVAAAIAARGSAGTRRALVVQQRTAKAHRLQVRIEQVEQGGTGIQRRAVFGGQLARGHAVTEEQQQVLALLPSQDMAEVIGHGQVI